MHIATDAGDNPWLVHRMTLARHIAAHAEGGRHSLILLDMTAGAAAQETKMPRLRCQNLHFYAATTIITLALST
jgi:hypothetical protein